MYEKLFHDLLVKYLSIFLFSNFADILFMKVVHDMNIECEMVFFAVLKKRSVHFVSGVRGHNLILVINIIFFHECLSNNY